MADFELRDPLFWGHAGAVVALNPPPAASGPLIAFGLAFSSITKNQIVAGLLSFGVFLFLYLIEIAQTWGGWAQTLVPYFSVSRHLEEFAKGVIDSRDVVYYLSFTALGLFLTKQSIESYRWRS